MRLALVSETNPAARVAALERWLVQGLPAQGIVVTRFACPASAAEEARVLIELSQRASQFELVHSLLGPRTLLWSRSLAAPIVLTQFAGDELPPPPLGGARPARERVFLVSERAQRPQPGRVLLGQIAPPGGTSPQELEALSQAYARAYRTALEQDRRARLDGEHDARPWGEYFVLEDAPGFKVKRIEVKPGQRLSYQKHAQRSEHWMIVRGEALVVLDGVEHRLRAGQTIDIPAGTAHRIGNPGLGPLSFVEVQTGPYLGEDDIVRLQDDYKR
jgi:mannose-6-phosphate isomerase